MGTPGREVGTRWGCKGNAGVQLEHPGVQRGCPGWRRVRGAPRERCGHAGSGVDTPWRAVGTAGGSPGTPGSSEGTPGN